MTTMFCVPCNRQIDAKRVIGVGTLILAFLTYGLWLLLIPFYEKRCPICKSSHLVKIRTE